MTTAIHNTRDRIIRYVAKDDADDEDEYESDDDNADENSFMQLKRCSYKHPSRNAQVFERRSNKPSTRPSAELQKSHNNNTKSTGARCANNNHKELHKKKQPESRPSLGERPRSCPSLKVEIGNIDEWSSGDEDEDSDMEEEETQLPCRILKKGPSTTTTTTALPTNTHRGRHNTNTHSSDRASRNRTALRNPQDTEKTNITENTGMLRRLARSLSPGSKGTFRAMKSGEYVNGTNGGEETRKMMKRGMGNNNNHHHNKTKKTNNNKPSKKELKKKDTQAKFLSEFDWDEDRELSGDEADALQQMYQEFEKLEF